MSIKDYNKKLFIKGNSTPDVDKIKQNNIVVSCNIPLWQLNLLQLISDKLEDESGCQVWYGYMKD